jgi:antitoxin MazE7
VADTTIKVDGAVRDRLAELAAERGLTIRDFVQQLASATPTRAELARRQADAVEYIRTHLRSDFGDQDLAAGEELWRDIAATQHGQVGAGDSSAA